MRKIVLVGLLLALGGVIFLAIREQKETEKFRRQNAGLQRYVTEAMHAQEAARESLRQQAEQIQKMQNEKDEAIRLRGEVTRLRQQLKQKESELANRLALRQTNSASTESTGNPLPVESFSATVRARLAWNQTLVTGGWKTQEGKHCFVLIEPDRIANSDPAQITLRTKYLELPDEVLAKHGLASLVSDKHVSTTQSTMTREQTVALFESLKDLPGVDLLSAPTLTMLDGREAQIKSVDVVKAPDGREFELGPRVNIVPQITANGDSVDLTVNAELNRRSK